MRFSSKRQERVSELKKLAKFCQSVKRKSALTEIKLTQKHTNLAGFRLFPEIRFHSFLFSHIQFQKLLLKIVTNTMTKHNRPKIKYTRKPY